MHLHPISTAVLAIHWLIVAGLSVRVITRRSPVGVSLAWLAVIASAPFVGAVAYLLFGEKRLGRRRAALIEEKFLAVESWQDQLRLRFEDIADTIGEQGQPLSAYATGVLGFPPLAGNHLQLLDSFGEVFDALVADIDAAEKSCELCFYIWHMGGRGEEVIDGLVRAAGRGVACRVLADGVGSAEFLKSDVVRQMRDAGVEVVTALPTGMLRTLFVRRDLRNHRKIVLIDDRVAYTGSQNLVDPRLFKQDSGVGEWVDAMVRLTGPAALALDAVFELDWSVETGSDCELAPLDVECNVQAGGSVVQVVPSGPDLRPEAIHQLLLTAIYAARHELVMTTPYFVPDEAILTALLCAARRGVAVTLIVPARNDSVIVRFASVAHFDELMSAGVTIALFDGGLLHTKSLTIDGSIGVFGSVNLDMRSLWLNFEISLFIYDRGFAQQLVALQTGYLQHSTLLELEAWRQRPAWRKFAESALRLAGPLL